MLNVDSNLLLEFENQLNPSDPSRQKIPVKILGYGEISTTFQIGDREDVAFKRLPPFANEQAREDYCRTVDEYCERLRIAGIQIVEYTIEKLTNSDGEHIAYVVQPKLPSNLIGNQWLQRCSNAELQIMLTKILENLAKVWRKNKQDGPHELLGLDSQISNWVFTEEVMQGTGEPAYLDISTPLFRRNGKERLNPEVFLKSMPSFLVWLVRLAFLQDVLDRYYNLRFVVIDIVANFHKEGHKARIPKAIETINRFFQNKASDMEIQPLTINEIEKYYRTDKFIWTFLLGCRKLDRFIKTKLLRQKYNFILPGKVKR